MNTIVNNDSKISELIDELKKLYKKPIKKAKKTKHKAKKDMNEDELMEDLIKRNSQQPRAKQNLLSLWTEDALLGKFKRY